VTVDGAEARHAVTVSRVRPGDRLRLGNGAGLLLEGAVLTAEAGQLTLRVDEASETRAATPRIHLVQALAKGDRDELAIQAATELGVDGITPWSAARSITKWDGPKIAKGHERWSSIVREASKQSIRAWLPSVAQLTSTKQLAVLAATTRMLLLDPTATGRLTEVAVPSSLARRAEFRRPNCFCWSRLARERCASATPYCAPPPLGRPLSRFSMRHSAVGSECRR
jgi:16S rRNA (uracil1498-N3)-methyltransferase